MKKCKDWLTQHQNDACILFFAEGLLGKDDTTLFPFKLGAFRLAQETSAVVVPLLLRGTQRVLRDVAAVDGESSCSSVIELIVSKPFDSKKY